MTFLVVVGRSRHHVGGNQVGGSAGRHTCTPSYSTLRDAWDAVHAHRGHDTPVPFRCSTCRYWHVEEKP